MNRKQAEEFISSVISAREEAPDKMASEAVGIYPGLHGDGRLIQHGTRINWHGVLKRASVDLYDMEQNTPDNAPALWEEIAYRDGVRIIPEVITPGLSFSNGEQGWWQGSVWRSLMDSNVWTPATNPVAWEVLADD